MGNRLKTVLTLGVLALLWGVYCIPKPTHTNPYDPKTPNTPPKGFKLPPDSLVKSVSVRDVELEWPLAADQDADDFEAYVIARGPYTPGADSSQIRSGMKQIARITSYARTNYLDRGLLPNASYAYAILVEDKGGLKSTPSPVRVRTMPFIKRIHKAPGEFLTATDFAVTSPKAGKIRFLALANRNVGGAGLWYAEFPSDPVQYAIADSTRAIQRGIVIGLENTKTDRRMRVDKNVGKPTPLENSLYKDLMQKIVPDRFTKPMEPYFSEPLSMDIDSGFIREYSISIDAMAAFGDTIFLGVSVFVRNDDSLVNAAAIVKVGKRTPQLGFRGVMTVVLPNGTPPLTFHKLKILTAPAGLGSITPDRKITGLTVLPDGKAVMITLDNLDRIILWNRVTGAHSQSGVEFNREGTMNSAIVGVKSEVIVAMARNGIPGVWAYSLPLGTSTKESWKIGNPEKRKRFFSSIQSVCSDSDGTIYTIDGAAEGVSVIVRDKAGLLVSKWVTADRRSLEFSTVDRLFSLGKTVYFTLDGKTLWRTLQ